MDNKPGIQQAGDIEIIDIILVDTKNNKEKGYNLLGMFTNVTLYEDIHSPILSGSITLVESQNLIEALPILGGEQLVIHVRTPSLAPINITTVITKVGTRIIEDKTNRYTLEFISYEGYVSLNGRISRAYGGNVGDIAKKVYKEEFKKDFVEIDSVDNRIKFVSTFWEPLKILNHLAARASYPNKNMLTPNFLFYQTTEGHMFKSMTTLFAKDAIDTFYFDKNPAREHLSDGKSVRDINREYATVRELTFIDSPDMLKNINDGVLMNRVNNIELSRKNISEKVYRYDEDFDKTPHISNNKFYVIPTPVNSGLRITVPTMNGLFDGYVDNSAEIISKRIPLMMQLEQLRLTIVVPGKTTYHVGQILSLWLNEHKSADERDSNRPRYDKIYSGRYLITKVMHTFDQIGHACKFEIVKDTSYSEIK